MTPVLEAKRRLEDAKVQAKEMVDRERARLGLEMIRARQDGGESQTTIGQKMVPPVGSQQVRDYERAYRAWAQAHPGESLD
jgi:hypothetical protein